LAEALSECKHYALKNCAILLNRKTTDIFIDFLPYVLNGPIELFLLGILLMSLEMNILHENNMLQDLLQICKFH